MIDFEKIIKIGDSELAEKIGAIIVDNIDMKKMLEKSWISLFDFSSVFNYPYYSCAEFWNDYSVDDWELYVDYMDFNKREEDNCRNFYISGKMALEIIKRSKQ